MREELEKNEQLILNRQHERLQLGAEDGTGNRARGRISSTFVISWLSLALLSLSAWVLRLLDVF